MSGAAVSLAGWPHVLLPGEAGAPALLALHGTGGDERELASLARSLAPAAAVLAPRGRVSEGGMLRYFRREPDPSAGGYGYRFPDLAERTDELAALVRAAGEEPALSGRPLYAVGYSNGANAATALMLRHPGLLAGAVLWRGLLPAEPPPGLDLSGTEVLALAGASDQLIPAADGERLGVALRAAGASVEERRVAAGHGLTEEDLTRARGWLEAHRAA